MAHNLLSIGALLEKSWHQFTRDWKSNTRITVWILVIAAFGLVRMVLVFVPQTDALKGVVGLFILFTLLLTMVQFAVNVIVGIMTPLRLMDFTLKRDLDAKAPVTKWPWKLFAPFLWVMVLTVLVQCIPLIAGVLIGWILSTILFAAVGTIGQLIAIVIGGLVFIIPSIYLSNLFSLSPMALLEDDKHGRAALIESARLVKGRWWATFWRRFVPSLIFGAIVLVMLAVLLLVTGLLATGIASGFRVQPSIATFLIAVPSVAVAYMVAVFAIELFCVPFLFIVKAKLFHALKHAR